jgi:flavin-dependent dehydrogenase
LSTTLRAEAAVIGGGPAGAIAAHTLAGLGRSVVLCEAATFPREHVGISLSPGVRRQLAFGGLDGLLDRPCHRGDVPIERRWGGETFEPAPARVTLVDRGAFDADLIDAVRRAGAQVLQPALVRAITRAGDAWRLDVRASDSDLVVEARFIIEASGRRTRFRARQRQSAPTLALCGNWRGSPAAVVRTSAQSVSWCWGAPMGPGRSVLVCFVDPQDFQRASGSLHERYLRLAHESGVLPAIGDLTLEGIPFTSDATPYLTDGESENLLRVGDADAALDPLSSSGVQAAIQSALAAGPIVNTLLTPGEDGAAALEFWRRRRTLRMAQHRDWTTQLYAEAFAHHPTRFWAERCEHAPRPAIATATSPLPHPDQLIGLSTNARLMSAPCLVGPLVKVLECVDHTSFAEPVAFVAGVRVSPLLQCLSAPTPARNVLAMWSASLQPRVAYALLAWAWRQGILRGVDDGQGVTDPAQATHCTAHAPGALKHASIEQSLLCGRSDQ